MHAFIHRIVRAAVEKTYYDDDKAGVEKRVNTIHTVLYSLLRVASWMIVVLIILSELDINIGPFLAAAGVAGLAFGFGAQYLIRDLIAGLFIILEDQYRKGDVIRVAGVSGLVENITLRKTTLRDLDGVQHHVPNGEISTTSNLTKLMSRAHFDMGISYESDLDKAIKIINEVGENMAKDENWSGDITTPIKSLGVNEFADSAVMIKLMGETKPGKQWGVMREYRRRLKMAFDREGIEIPYPHRTIINKH